MVATCAKRIEEADAEVSEAIDFVEYYCHQALELEQIEHLKLHSRGVAFVAPPWNFPLAIALGSLVGALLTGHSVLFKPAPMAAAVGYTLAQMVWKIGISKQVLQFICLDEQEVGSRLLKDPRVDIACLTGSSETARLFLKWAPSRPLIAETGGKNVIIISNTCDRDLAIKDLLQSAFSHSGQKCSAASLTILHEELYRDPKFWQQLIDAASSLHVGSSWDTASKITPLLMTDDPKLVWALTELEEGQEWVLKPKQDPKNPRLWSPGLVKGVKKGSRRHEEEFFGPVLGFMPYRHLSEAIEIANQTPYGLTCGLYTLSEEEQDLWSRQMLAGNLYVNRPITGALVHRQPFGGTKASRIGQGKKAGGPHYLLSFYAPGDSKPDHYQIRYPEKLSQILCLASSEIALELEPIFKSYSYWYLHFTREIDPVRIPGQDNFYFLKAQEDYLIRWEKEEGNEKDFWCALAAACLCQAKVIVSAKAWPGKKEPPAFIEFYSAGQQWLDTWKKYSLQTVRFIGKPTHETLEKLAHLNITSLLDPVCYHGRYELLHPLREVSFCRDYHRYGNLGLQSHQTPHP
jgi:RHH-type proline utilization regulon transcriptional repressor/proline dehydrogenase/delta 1-pyrroline-5-carboxylate dehydrogenase